jgi:O-antigen ligase
VRLIGASNPLDRPRTHHSRPKFVSAEGGNWYDRAFVTGVVLLVMLTPLPMGAVHPWAFITIELTVFALVAIWMAKIAFADPIQFQPALGKLRPLVVPLGLFVAFTAFALVPLPPALLRVLSPATYQTYSVSLGGWPATAPYRDLLDTARATPAEIALPPLPGAPKQAESLAQNPDHQNSGSAADSTARLGAGVSEASRWRPLSLEPSLTRELLLKIAAYSALFFAVMLYPFGPSMNGESEKRFYRWVLVAILASGLLVACVGILERVFWNGKILWLFIPYDWGRAQPELFGRARGPFVNPDHFASYLNLVLPIAVAGLVFPTFMTRRRNSEPFRVFCTVVAFIISIALLLSLSRAGWIGAVVGMLALVLLAYLIPREKRPWVLRLRPWVTVPLCAALVVLILATTSVFVGDRGRNEADVRLKDTVSLHQSLGFRINVWRDTIPMVRDFPIFGIGLGAFGDVFPHYQSPPWKPSAVYEAHNDYLELLVSAGAIGFILCAWFFAAIDWRLYRGLRALPPDVLAVAAALIAAMSAMAFQEFFDFNLQIPANAVLLALLLALAMRLIATARLEQVEAAPPRRSRLVLAGSVTAVAMLLALVALGQDLVPYPFNLKVPRTPVEARDLVLAHPAVALPHLWMATVLGGRISPSARAKELAAGVWLDKTNPALRDLYAQSLLFAGRPADTLKQITISVYNSPWLDDHYYLTVDNRGRLTPADRAAVEKGLEMAVAHNFKNAVWALAGFYGGLREFANESELLIKAAGAEPDPALRESLLVAAGLAEADGGRPAASEKYFREAMALDPANPDSYSGLATRVFGPQKRIDAARALVDEGIRNGADPFTLELALADAAEIAGDNSTMEKALLDASDIRPSDDEAALRLGELYMSEKRFDQAVLLLTRTAELHPDSAPVLHLLGRAEEANYQFYAAGNDLARAAQLAPDDVAFRADYEDFQKKANATGAISNTAVATP